MEVGGKREIIYLSLHCHHQNDSCIKMGSNESHFNVSVGSDGQSHKTVYTNPNLSEEKGEPKRYRTEVLPLTSLMPYRWAKPTHLIPSEPARKYKGYCCLENILIATKGGNYQRNLSVGTGLGNMCACATHWKCHQWGD